MTSNASFKFFKSHFGLSWHQEPVGETSHTDLTREQVQGVLGASFQKRATDLQSERAMELGIRLAPQKGQALAGVWEDKESSSTA